MVGCLNGGIDNEHLCGTGYGEIGIGAFQPSYIAKRQLVFDRNHVYGWKSVDDHQELPQVEFISKNRIYEGLTLWKYVIKKCIAINFQSN